MNNKVYNSIIHLNSIFLNLKRALLHNGAKVAHKAYENISSGNSAPAKLNIKHSPLFNTDKIVTLVVTLFNSAKET